MPIKGQTTPLIDRIQGKFTVNAVTGCWQWQRSLSSQGKYPTIGAEGSKRPIYVHRAMWESVNGPIPTAPPADGSSRYEVHHRCNNRQCVNPGHLELLTKREHAAEHNVVRAAIREAKAA